MKPLETRLSSKEIDTLIINYRNGDTEAAEKLLQCFRPLIGKYLNLFFYGTFNRNDADIIKFLEVCGKKDIYRTAEIIRTRLKKYEAEELVAIARASLLEAAKFHDNISGSYRYILRKYLENMLWEDFPDGMPTLELSEAELSGYKTKETPVEINNDWIEGSTPGDGFSTLSEFQRLIVKLCYYDNIPDIHIVNQLHISLSELKKTKDQIKNILSKELNLKSYKEKGR